jgi:predicted phage tail protein
MFSANFLFASLFWGSVGVGYFIYGKKQGSWLPMVGGAAMVAASCFIASALLMSLLCAGVVVAVYSLLQRGY